MRDLRSFHPDVPPSAQVITLSAEEAHHLVTVNRARVGDEVIVFDGAGTEWIATLAQSDRRSAVLAVQSIRQALPRSCSITLAQAMPKGGTMETIVRQATEIGVSEIRPLFSERTQVQLDARKSDRKQDKWLTTAIEAAKQCGNPWLPNIAPPERLAETLAAVHQSELKLVASLHPGAQHLAPTMQSFRATHGRGPRSATWLVGPEGDFSPAEMTEILAAGFLPIRLGSLVLRCDTAVTYALAALGELLPDPA